MLQVKVGADISEAIAALKKFGTEIDRAGGVTQATAIKMSSALNKVLDSAKNVGKGVNFSGLKDKLEQATSFNDLDFTAKFEAAKQRLNASIDQMANEALGIKVEPQISVLPAINSIKSLENEMAILKDRIINSTDPREIQKLSVQFGALEAEANQLKNTFEKVSQLKIVAPFGNIIPANLQQSVAAFGGGVKKASSELTALGRSSINASSGLKTVSTSLNQIPRTGGAATQSLINLGRIAQDLPFGFLGIANNLNPMLESFQRTQKEAGGTGAALKLIGKELIGAGGLGLALSVVTALMSFASIGFSAWTRGMGGATKATDEAKKANDDYKESVHNAFNEVAQEAGKVEVLVAALKQGNLTYAERKGAIEELKRIAPSYFTQLNTEKLNIDLLNSSYKNYLKSLQNAAEAKVLEKQLEGIIDKRLELEKVLNPPQFTFDAQGNRIQNIVLETAKTQKIRNENQAEYNNLLKGEEILSNRIAQLKPKDIIVPDIKTSKSKEQKFSFLFDFLPFDPNGKLKPEQRGQLLDAIDKFQKEFSGIIKGVQFKGLPEERIQQAKTFDIKLKAGNVQFDFTKLKEEADKIKIEDLLPGGLDFSKSLQKDEEGAKQLIDQFISGVQNEADRIKGLSLFGDLDLSKDLGAAIDLFKTRVKQIGGEIPKVIEGIGLQGQPVQLTFEDLFDTSKIANNDALDAIKKAFDKIKERVKSISENLTNEINNALFTGITGGLSNIGDAIGQALGSNGNILQAAFQSIFTTIGDLVQQIGKALIQYGAIKEGLDKILEGGIVIPGIAAIALGVSAVAIGALIKNSFKNAKGFAKGGWVGGTGNGDTVPAMLTPGEYVVTKDKAPFVATLLKSIGKFSTGLSSIKLPLHFAQGGFVPNINRTGADILSPLNQLQKTLGGSASQNINVTVDGRVQGKDIVFAVAKVVQSQNRNFGRGGL